MTLRELAEVGIVARRTAARVGRAFEFNYGRLVLEGIPYEDIMRVERAIHDIEEYTSAKLAELDAPK